jgi:hypothetical protein
MEVAALAILIAAFVGGFLLAGRWANSVVLQLILGAALGVAIIAVVGITFLGVAFAGCLLMSGGKVDFK